MSPLGVATLLMSLSIAQPGDVRSTADARYLAGLRHRQLFSLAEVYCETQLAESALAPRRRVELVIEYSRTLSEHALSSPPRERDALWQRAAEIPRQFARDFPQDAQLLLVEAQIGLVLSARGELLWTEAEITGASELQVAEARTQLRAAIRHLQSVQEQIARQLFDTARPATPAGDEFSSEELRAMARNVSFQLARALRHQGQTYPAGSADRADALVQATGLLAPLCQQETNDGLPWQSRLEEAACFRLLENYQAAARSLDMLTRLNPAPTVQLDIRAERIRLALAQRQLDEAVKIAEQSGEPEAPTSGTLDFAVLEALLAAWAKAETANDKQAAAAWETRASEVVQRMERTHGVVWTRRAEMLLARHLSSGSSAGNIDSLARAADGLYRAGQIDQALVAYDAAAQVAQSNGLPAAAFDMAYKAAAIVHGRGEHRDAAERYRRLALAMPAHSTAGDAHLLAIFNLGQLLTGETEATLEEYRSLLAEHLSSWPSAASADQARGWLGRLLEREGDPRAAVDAYRQIAATHPQFAEGVAGAERCYQLLLADPQGPPAQRTQTAQEAVDHFERLLAGPDGSLPDRFDPARRTAALAAARIRLGHLHGQFERAEALLSNAIARSPDATHEWRSAATAMLVYSLAAQPARQAAAGDVLDRMSQGSPAELLNLAEQLEALAATAADGARQDLAELQLRACQMLVRRREALAPEDRVRLDRSHAAALAAAGRRDEAHVAYKHLAEQYPRDGRVQEDYAVLLSSAGDSSAEAALKQWRTVEKHSRAGTPRWFRAKYQLAELHLRLGDAQRAAKIIRLTEVLHPDLGGADMAADFRALLAQCERN